MGIDIYEGVPSWVVDKVQEALNGEGKSVKGARVLVLGLSYKPDIDDDWESPSCLHSAPLSADEFSRYDCLVLSTAHAEFKESTLYAGVRLVVDTRDVVRPDWGPRVARG